MTLSQLVEWAKNKNRFQTIDDYSAFIRTLDVLLTEDIWRFIE